MFLSRTDKTFYLVSTCHFEKKGEWTNAEMLFFCFPRLRRGKQIKINALCPLPKKVMEEKSETKKGGMNNEYCALGS